MTRYAGAVISGTLADLVLLVHLGFVVFVAAGALAVWRWPRLAWLHVPAALWGAFVEFSGRVCPLTPLEDALRGRAGGAGSEGGFIDRSVTAILYPDGLTRRQQLVLGALAIAVNVAAYTAIVLRRKALPRRRPSS